MCVEERWWEAGSKGEKGGQTDLHFDVHLSVVSVGMYSPIWCPVVFCLILPTYILTQDAD